MPIPTDFQFKPSCPSIRVDPEPAPVLALEVLQAGNLFSDLSLERLFDHLEARGAPR